MKNYYIYILASQKNGTLYVGVTNDLIRRVWEHKNKLADGFTKKHSIDQLVYFEVYEDIESAILREKQLKRWGRQKKLNLFENENPSWEDLYYNLI
ncbi:MAG: GIY-YIG nuclease family protein [Alphaproteobacteria bacterium]|nr:GIY-YIG nuclease family protein [Alphaproteobacteria bacterium]